MKIFLVFIALIFFLSCAQQNSDIEENKPTSELTFDQDKWLHKEGKDYPYRSKMLNDVVYNDTIRTLNKKELLQLLGAPTYYREDTTYLYYLIDQKTLLSWPLHTTTMVVKIDDDQGINWNKIHK